MVVVELFHSMKHKVWWMALKGDTEKAYDRCEIVVSYGGFTEFLL